MAATAGPGTGGPGKRFTAIHAEPSEGWKSPFKGSSVAHRGRSVVGGAGEVGDGTEEGNAHANKMNAMALQTQLNMSERGHAAAVQNELEGRQNRRGVAAAGLGKMAYTHPMAAVHAERISKYLDEDNLEMATYHANAWANLHTQGASESKAGSSLAGQQLQPHVQAAQEAAAPEAAAPESSGAEPAKAADNTGYTPLAPFTPTGHGKPAELTPQFEAPPAVEHEPEEEGAGVGEREAASENEKPESTAPPETPTPSESNVPEAAQPSPPEPGETPPVKKEADEKNPAPEPAPTPSSSAGNPAPHAPVPDEAVPSRASSPSSVGTSPPPRVIQTPHGVVQSPGPVGVGADSPTGPVARISSAGTQPQQDDDSKKGGRLAHFGLGIGRQAANKVFPTETGRSWGPQGGKWVGHEDAAPGRLLEPGHKDAGAYNRALTNWNAANNLPAPTPHDWAGHYYQHPVKVNEPEAQPVPTKSSLGDKAASVARVAVAAGSGAATGAKAPGGPVVKAASAAVVGTVAGAAAVNKEVKASRADKHSKGSPPPVHEHAPLAKNGNPVFIPKSAPVSNKDRLTHNKNVIAWRRAQLEES